MYLAGKFWSGRHAQKPGKRIDVLGFKHIFVEPNVELLAVKGGAQGFDAVLVTGPTLDTVVLLNVQEMLPCQVSLLVCC